MCLYIILSISNSGGQRTSPKSSTVHPPVNSLSMNPSCQELELSPPPPPTPLSPLDGRGNMEFPPPPPELAPASNTKRSSPKQEPSEQTVRQATQEGSMPLTSPERITPSFAEQLQQWVHTFVICLHEGRVCLCLFLEVLFVDVFHGFPFLFSL